MLTFHRRPHSPKETFPYPDVPEDPPAGVAPGLDVTERAPQYSMLGGRAMAASYPGKYALSRPESSFTRP